MKVVPLLFFAAVAVAGPVDRTGTCSRHCTAGSKKFEFDPNTAYVYSYTTWTETSVQGTTEDKVTVKLSCQVELEPLGGCDFSIQVRETNLEEEGPTRSGGKQLSPSLDALRRDLEKNPLKFSYHDGRVENLCPSEADSPRVLNIKKGILSVIQNSMKSLEGNEEVLEVDISGKCPTVYETLPKGWSSITIRKTKDLSLCKDRESTITALQASAEEGNLRSTPVVKGHQECKQTFKNKLLESVECKETHVVRPFSRQEKGAVTNVFQTMTLRTQRRRVPSRAVYSSGPESDLLFDHDYDSGDATMSLARAEDALRSLANTAGEIVMSSTPGMFTELVYSLRKLNINELQTVLRSAESMSPKAKKYLMDALPAVGTPSSVQMMTEAMVSGKVNGIDADEWLTSLAFVSKPTLEMLEQAVPLLKLERLQAYLGVSTLAHSYCFSHSDCDSARPVKEIVRALYMTLGENCYARDARMTLMVLKALGNLGQSEGAEDTLFKCIKNPQLDIEIRLAAVQSFRRFSCDIPRTQILKMYQNVDENVELRIAAYLAVMKCPSEPVIEAVKETIRAESIKQVGSFVYSHIRNLAKNPSPFQKEYRSIANDLQLKNRFDLDFRKFSRNIHYRMFFDPLDTGFELDGNLVYTPDSYYPRSLMVGTAFDIFGKKINLFEAGARAENVDKYLEKIFPQEHQNAVRAKRAISDNKIEDLGKKFAIKQKYSGEPKGSGYIRLFGNEIAALQVGGDAASPYSELSEWIMKFSDPRGLDLSKSVLFADTTLTVPASNGLPLRVSVNGSATAALRIGGKSELKTGSVDINGQIKPSGAVELSLLMSVDAHKAISGVKMVATMASSWVVDGSLQMTKGKALKAQLNFPRNEMEIIDVKSKIFLVNSASEVEHQNEPQKKTEAQACTGSTLKEALGIQICGKAEFPVSSQTYGTPMYPFSGNAELNVVVRKVDPTLTSYNFEASWTDNQEMIGAVITMNTPGTSVDREITAEMQHNRRDGTIAFRLKTPPKKFTLEGMYNFDKKLKKLNINAKVDQISVFQVSTELKADISQSEKSLTKYSYFGEIHYRGESMLLVNGQWNAVHGRKYSGNLNIEKITEKPVQVKMDLDLTDKSRVKYEASIKSFFIDGSLNGFTQSGENWSTKLSGAFSLMSGRTEKIDFTAKFRDLSAGSLTKYNGAASFQNSFDPSLDTDLLWDCQKTDGQLENTLQINTGSSKKYGHSINIQQIVRYTGTFRNNNAALILKVKYPQRRVDWGLEMKHENTEASLANKMDITYGPRRQLSTVIELAIDPESKANVQLSYPGREMKMSGNYRKIGSDEYKGNVMAQWNRDKKIEASGTLKLGMERRQYSPSIDLEILIPNRRPVRVSGSMKTAKGYYLVKGSSECSQGKYEISGMYKTADMYSHEASVKLDTPKDNYAANGAFKFSSNKVIANANIKMGRIRDVILETELVLTSDLKTAKFDVKWDAAKDPTRHASINGEFRQASGGYQGNFVVKCPKQNIRGAISTTIQGRLNGGVMRVSSQGELEWQPRKKITYTTNVDWNPDYRRRSLKADAQITTPYQSLNAFELALTHNDDGREWNTESKAVFPNGRTLTVSSDGNVQSDRNGRTLRGTLKVNTPSGRMVSLMALHDLSSYDTNNKIELRWGENKITSAEISGAYGSGLLKVKAEAITPIQGYERLLVSFDHSYRPGLLRCQAVTEWGSNRRITFGLNGQRTQNSQKKACDASVRITTPFSGAEEMSTKITYSKEGSKISADMEAKSGYNKISSGLMLSKRMARSGDLATEMRLYFTSPIREYEDLETTASYTTENDKFRLEMNSRLPYSKSASLRSNGRITSINNFESFINIQVPIRRYERWNLEISHALDSRSLKTTGQFGLGQNKYTMELTSDHAFLRGSHNMDAKLMITTPFSGYEEAMIDLHSTRRDGSYDCHFHGRSGRSTMKINHNMKMTNLGNFENSLQISTPFSSFPALSMKSTNEAKNGMFSHNSVIEWQGKKVALVVDASASQSRNENSMETKIQLVTPWRILSKANLVGSYNTKRHEIRPQISLEWNEGNSIALEGAFTNRRFSVVDARVSLTSSFKPIESIMLNTRYDISKELKTGELSFQWSPRPEGIATLTGSASFRDSGADIAVSCTTPIRGYERLQLTGTYKNKNNAKSGSIILEAQWNKITLEGKLRDTGYGNAVELTLTTPIRGWERQQLTGEYNVDFGIVTSNIKALWRENEISLETALEDSDRKTAALMVLKTPYPAMKKLEINLEATATFALTTLTGVLQYNTNKIEVTGSLDSNERTGKLQWRSPFKNLEEIELTARIQEDGPRRGATGLVRWAAGKEISFEFGGAPGTFSIDVTTPFTGYRHLSYLGVTEYQKDAVSVSVDLQKDNRKISFKATGRQSQNNIEGDIKISTPFELFEDLSLSGSLRTNGMKEIAAALNLRTQIEQVRNVDIRAEYNNKLDSYNCLFSIDAPNIRYELKGQMTYQGMKLIDGQISLTTPHRELSSMTIKINLKTDALRTINGEFVLSTPGGDHALTADMKNYGQFEGTFEVKCPMLPSGRASLTYRMNPQTSNLADFRISAEYAREIHSITGNFESKRGISKAEVRLESPKMKEGPAAVRIELYAQRSHEIKALVKFGFEPSMNEINIDATANGGLLKCKVTAESNMLPSRSLTVEGMVANSHHGIDISMSYQDTRSSHLLTANWKQASGTADGQLKIDSPLLSLRTLSGSMSYQNHPDKIEGTLVLATPAKSIKCFGALKGSGFRNIEGNLKIETPFRSLRFANLNLNFNNENNQIIDGSVSLKTSIPSLSDASVAGKIRSTSDTFEVGVDGRLPIRSLSAFEHSFTCKYNPDLTVISPRLIISLPNARFVSYGEMNRNPRELTITAGHEWGIRQKVEAHVAIKKPMGQFKVEATLSTPFRGMERYEMNMMCARESEKRIFQATLKDPASRTFEIQHSNTYYSPLNFNFENTITTPIRGLQLIGLRLRQQSSRSRLVSNLEGSVNYLRIIFNLDHDKNTNAGNIQISTPYPEARNVKLAYEINRYKVDGEFTVNDRRVMKVAGASEHITALRSHKCDLMIDIPAIRMSLEGHYKPVPSGAELSGKCSSVRRTINFQTLYQNAPHSLIHQASLKWGQEKAEEFSYDLRTTQSKRRDLKNTDLSCKLNFPLRAFEIRASQSQRQNVNTMSCELFWDAARDQNKHVTINIEHQNLSSRSVWAHKVAATLSHPRLSKDIVMRLDGSLSSDELHGKTELEYSRDQSHNLILEGRLKSQGPAHYTAELTARQPVSYMDIRTMADIKNGRDEASALITVNYMNRNRQMRIKELKASIFKIRQAIDILIRNGRDQSHLKGQMYNRDQELGLELEHTVNDMSPTKTHFRMNRRHSNMELSYVLPDASSAIMSATASADKGELRVSHKTLGRSISDLLIKTGLREKRYLGSDINWRPELANEASDYISERYSASRQQLVNTWDSFAEETRQEIMAKKSIMGTSISTQIRPLLEDIKYDIRVIGAELSEALEKVKTMYYQDQLYMRTVLSAFSGVAEATGQIIKDAGRLTYAVTKHAVQLTADALTTVSDKISNIVDRFAMSSRRTLIFVERVLFLLTERASLALVDATEFAMRKIVAGVSEVAQKTVALLERYGPSTTELRQTYNRAMDAISSYTAPIMETIWKNPFVQGFVSYMGRVKATLNAFSMEAMSKRYEYAYNAVAGTVNDVYENVVYHPHVQYVNDMAQRVARKARDITEQLGMHDMAASVIDMARQQLQDSLLDGLTDAVREYSNIRSGMRVEYAPQRGVISAELRLPSPKENLYSALDITSYPEYDKVMKLRESFIDAGAHSVWDTYYKYKHHMDPKNWMPPFKARGLVAGSQHYRTFDGFHFDFAGECSYLLAKDFLNDQFAVVVNYARDGERAVKKSVTVYSDGQRFDIGSDYKITKGNNKIELPLETDGTTIRREGHVIIVEDKNGLNVRCNLAYDQCITEVTGSHFGKTGGLLGTYDYEDKLDIMTPERRITEDITMFANEWEVGQGRCRSQRNMAQLLVPNSKEANDIAKKYFHDDESVFRSCFKLVDPEPYLMMSLRDMATASYGEMEQKICISAAAYREECREFGINLEMPRTCVRCEKPDGTELLSGDITTVTEDDPGKTADVVFVVERKLCNKNVIPNLIRLAQGIDERYTSKGLSDIRYAVVGFGGDGVANDAHVVTADGQIFSSIRSVISAFSSLTIGQGNNDVFAALQYAAQLPVRMGSTQVMVLVKCTSCKPGEDPSVYSDIYRMLVDRGVHLHILDDDDFNVRTASKPSKSKRIFGVDRRLAYTVKDIKDLHGDADLHSQIRLPKDFCVPLALETNGTLFSSMKMFEKRNVNKKFIDVMARRIARSSAPDCQICECVSLDDGVGQSVCTRCASPLLGPLLSPDFSPSMYEEATVERKAYKRPKTKKLRHQK